MVRDRRAHESPVRHLEGVTVTEDAVRQFFDLIARLIVRQHRSAARPQPGERRNIASPLRSSPSLSERPTH
jgi:hypothetical protein